MDYRFEKIGDVSAVNASQVGKTPFGIGFEKLDRGVFDPEKAYDKVAAIGVKWIRLQSGWARTEKQENIYDFAWLDSIVDNLLLRGLLPWMCLCYGNGLYDQTAAKYFGAVGCPPVKTPGQKQAWHNYVVATTQHFKGRITWFEIWNEPDGEWCWKTGVNGTEYGEFVKATAAAILEGNPEAKVIAGSFCSSKIEWLDDMLKTGAAQVMDALSYHSYSIDEVAGAGNRINALRALCHAYNPNIKLIQGETGAQSRPDGAGALRNAAWTPEKQAKCLARLMLAHLFQNVEFTSYFSCMDMIEALNGLVGDKKTYLDYGYFGVLGADFDEDGVATGDYRPKPSYRTLQVLAAIFREQFSLCELPVVFMQLESSLYMRQDDTETGLICRGFRKPNGSSAFVYWKPSDLLTTTYEASISLKIARQSDEYRLVNLLDGSIYKIPDKLQSKLSPGCVQFNNLPLRDYPLLLTFGDFIAEKSPE